MRILADIAGARIGPGPAFVVLGAGRLAGLIALVALQPEILVIAAEPVDRKFLDGVARFDHAGAAHARDAAIILDARRHAVLEPAHRAAGVIGRVVETPRPAAAGAPAHPRPIHPLAEPDPRTLLVA